MRAAAVLFLAVALGGCATLSDEDTNARRIVGACTASHFFRPIVQGGVLVAVPEGYLPLRIVEAGVDVVCADPRRYAHDITTANWVEMNLLMPQ